VLVAVIVVTLLSAQWFRSVPTPVFHSALATSIRLPGTPPTLPWPSTGSAEVAVEGAGDLGGVRNGQPTPIAGLAKVMTAYVVLRDHPLALGAAGPAIPVTAPTIAAARADAATQQSVVPVASGETLTELQALEGLLVAQGNDMATLLTDWDATSTAAFVAKMNADAHALGLRSTTFTDPSGLDPGSVSTPADLIRLGEAAMTISVFRAIVAMPQVTLPLAGLVYNFDYDLGHDGIVGIKTGSDAAAGGCFLFLAQESVGGHTVTLVGAVLGQTGFSPISTALSDAELLTHDAFASIHSFPLLRQGSVVGTISTAWGSSDPSLASGVSVVGWPGLSVPVQDDVKTLSAPVASHARIGALGVGPADQRVEVALHASRLLPGPSPVWRLTRL
jgi:D-alanyl-D-alanine carboxypeptidase (penicillin-binding protein 5/6)